ncbi:hypothetical protein Tco_0458690 [Tanacetum coccineum]
MKDPPLVINDLNNLKYEMEDMRDDAFGLIRKEVNSNNKIPKAMFPVLEEFSNVFSDELHYRMSLGEHEELRNGHVHERMCPWLPYHGYSSDDDLVGNSRRNFIYPWGNDVGPSVEEWTLLFLEAQDRFYLRVLFGLRLVGSLCVDCAGHNHWFVLGNKATSMRAAALIGVLVVLSLVYFDACGIVAVSAPIA